MSQADSFNLRRSWQRYFMLRKEFVRQVDSEEKAEPEEDEAHHAEDEGDLKVAEAAEVLPTPVVHVRGDVYGRY